MASVANFGKGFIQSVFSRLRHPLWNSEWGAADWTQRLGVEQYNGLPALWMIPIRQTYFAIGINVDHDSLADMHGQAAGCVYGYSGAVGVTTPHSTANRWYSGNQVIFLDPTDFAAPAITPDMSTLTLPTKVLTFLTGQASGQFPMTDIGGIALCTTNTANASNQVVAIYNFSTGPVTATSSGQTLTISNGTVVLTEA